MNLTWIKTSDDLPRESERVLCLFNGEPIVLELGSESPTHEETFKSFYFWFEPYQDMFHPEWYEVTHWARIEIAEVVV